MFTDLVNLATLKIDYTSFNATSFNDFVKNSVATDRRFPSKREAEKVRLELADFYLNGGKGKDYKAQRLLKMPLHSINKGQLIP